MSCEGLYMLHIWQEGEDTEAWRASLEETRSQKVRHFKTLASLVAYLKMHAFKRKTYRE